jgi:hypothetical protein
MQQLVIGSAVTVFGIKDIVGTIKEFTEFILI